MDNQFPNLKVTEVYNLLVEKFRLREADAAHYAETGEHLDLAAEITIKVLQLHRTTLVDLEEQFLEECRQGLGLGVRADWEQVRETTLALIRQNLSEYPETERRRYLLYMLSKIEIAKLIQVNKFTVGYLELTDALQQILET
jgi:hypothetical protein